MNQLGHLRHGWSVDYEAILAAYANAMKSTLTVKDFLRTNQVLYAIVSLKNALISISLMQRLCAAPFVFGCNAPWRIWRRHDEALKAPALPLLSAQNYDEAADWMGFTEERNGVLRQIAQRRILEALIVAGSYAQ